jgi:hypothetical protein
MLTNDIKLALDQVVIILMNASASEFSMGMIPNRNCGFPQPEKHL